jgi:cytochrome d ubiquinol oxidase subunit I
VTLHYLFAQLTMGLALLILILNTMVLRTGDEHYNRADRQKPDRRPKQD